MAESRRTNGGDWFEYQRLVLAELERLDKLIDESRKDRQRINLGMDRIERNVQALEKRVNRIDDDQLARSLISRINTLEDSGLSNDVLKRYRKWLISLVIALVGSIALPIITLIITAS